MSAPPRPDGLHVREGLPAEFKYLLPEVPRAEWPTMRLHATARFWLDRHDAFRRLQSRIAARGGLWRTAGEDSVAYQRQVTPLLAQFIPALDGHHQIESGHYFPAFSASEPRMRAGFELLDRDHEAVHAVLAAMVEAANGLIAAVRSGAPAATAAAKLADVVDGSTTALSRHLDDEEDIVVPLLTLRGDPLGLG